MGIQVLGSQKLAPFLKRHMQLRSMERVLRLDEFLRLVLEKANEFVPSRAGVIYLDDPATKKTRFRENNMLAAVACFGPGSRGILGKRFEASHGIVGLTYVTGKPYYCRDVAKDHRFAGEGKIRSILCVPIAIRGSAVGVLKLVDRRGQRLYSAKDFELLSIFSDYISASIQNFLDARRNAEMACRDALTGLLNDRALDGLLKKEASRAWRAGRELSVVFVDLDRFKQINDRFGHLAGSQVLAEIGHVLRTYIEWPRAQIARYGGDEYVVVLPGADASAALAAADKVLRALHETPFLSGRIKVTASFGVASLLAHVGANDPARLLKLADQAMYEAKRTGRNRSRMTSVARHAGMPAQREQWT